MAKVTIVLKSGRKIEFDPEFYNELKLVRRLEASGEVIKDIRREK